jgi:predicted phosphoribosyltransferase
MVVSLISPEDFSAVGQFYADFTQVSDAEVIEVLSRQRTEK